MKLFETICILTFVMHLLVTQIQGQVMCYQGLKAGSEGTIAANTAIVAACPVGYECGRADLEVNSTIHGTAIASEQSHGVCIRPGLIAETCANLTAAVRNTEVGTHFAETCCYASCSTDRCNEVAAIRINGFVCSGEQTTGTGLLSTDTFGSAESVGQHPLKSMLISLLVFFVVMNVCK